MESKTADNDSKQVIKTKHVLSKYALRTAVTGLIIASLLLSTAAFFYFQEKQRDQLFNRLARTIVNQQEQLQRNTLAIEQLNKTVDTLEQQLHHTTQLADNTWRLNLAKYFTYLANYNLTYLRDTGSAITLLHHADQQIEQLNDPKLEKIRMALANNIMTLRTLPKLDRAGVLAQLNALQIQATHLPALINSTDLKPSAKNSTPSANASDVSAWRTFWEKTKATLKGLLVIRYTQETIEPILSAEQQVYLQQNLQLILQQAIASFLRGEQALYETSLEQAKQWTLHYFITNLSSTQTVVKTMTELQALNIQPALPDLSATLDLMQQAIRDAETNHPASPTTPVESAT